MSNHRRGYPTKHGILTAGIDERLRDRLVRVGLLDPEVKKRTPTLGEFLASYLSAREAELKPSTMMIVKQAARFLLQHLKPDTPLDKIGPAEADQLRAEILRGRARATANKRTRYIKEVFQAAVNRGLIPSNPFAHIRGLAVVGQASRRVFIPRSDIARLLDTIPCPQFRLIVALARFAGLRTPSETLALTWADIDWANSRMIVRSPKLEHHADGGIRVIPIFYEVRPYLEAVWDQAKEGDVYVITRYRDATQNLRTQLNRWILQAGLTPWPKPYQNMRASLATELADLYPSHVCTHWLGHSLRIADQFYRSVTDEHYKRASSGTDSGTLVAQIPAQQVSEGNGTEMKSEKLNPCGVGDSAIFCDSVRNSAQLTSERCRTRTCDSSRVRGVLYR